MIGKKHWVQTLRLSVFATLTAAYRVLLCVYVCLSLCWLIA